MKKQHKKQDNTQEQSFLKNAMQYLYNHPWQALTVFLTFTAVPVAIAMNRALVGTPSATDSMPGSLVTPAHIAAIQRGNPAWVDGPVYFKTLGPDQQTLEVDVEKTIEWTKSKNDDRRPVRFGQA